MIVASSDINKPSAVIIPLALILPEAATVPVNEGLARGAKVELEALS